MDELEYSILRKELLLRILPERNGAVVDSMHRMGVSYELSYGVSIPTLRAIAADMERNHRTARTLFKEGKRELKLLGIMTADPSSVTAEEVGFWLGGVVNTEVAEHLASTLLGETAQTGAMIGKYLEDGDDMQRYCVLMAASANLRTRGRGIEWNYREVTESLVRHPELYEQSRYRSSFKGLTNLLGKVCDTFQECRADVRKLLEEGSPLPDDLRKGLTAEIGWML